MSMPLMQLTIKKNWPLALIFFGVLAMYSGVMISMYNPGDMESLMQMFELFPPEVMSALGFAGAFSDMTGYLASWLYGLLMIGFPMVYSIILAGRLVAKTVDSGSIACLLATPDSRGKIILTKAVYAVLSLTAILGLLFLANCLLGKALYPDDLDVAAFFQLNVTVTLVNITVLSISFFFSCLFNDTKYSLAFGAGLPIAFLLMHMLGGASPDAEIVRKLSIFGWYDPLSIVNGETVPGVNLLYGLLSLLLLGGGILIFRKKRLPI